MIKNAFLILMACASLTIANSSKAGLGWSLVECQDHYGNSLRPEPKSEYGRQKYAFRTGVYDISVWLFDDTVTSIKYRKVDGSMISSNEIGTLLQVNAPKADWSGEAEKDSTGLLWWYGQMSRDPFAYQAKYSNDHSVAISTRSDLEMVKSRQGLEFQSL